VLEIRDESALETVAPTLRRVAETAPKRLFDGVKDGELKELGIDEQVLPIVRLLTTEAHLDALQNLLPSLQYDVLVALAAGMSAQNVWAEISKNLVDAAPPKKVDPDDLAAAIERTPGQVRLVEGPAELAAILEHPFAAWRVFLHPSQQKIAYRESYSGPVMAKVGPNLGVLDAGGKYELHRAVATLSMFKIPHVVVWDEDAVMQQAGTTKHREAECRDQAALDVLKAAAADPGSTFAGGVRLSGTVERWLGITEEKTGAWKSANLGASMTDAYADPVSDVPEKVEGLLGLLSGLFDNADLASLLARPEFRDALVSRRLGAPTVDLAAEVAGLPRAACLCRPNP
jgi:hypothetical protein